MNGAKESHTHTIAQKRGKNLSLLDNNHDTCPQHQLTMAKTKVYIIRNYLLYHQEVPHTSIKDVCSFPIFPPFSQKLMLTKNKNNHHYLSGCKTLLLPFRFPSGCPYSLSVSVAPPFRSLHSYIGNAFHKHTPGAISICPTPQHFPGS